MLENSAVILTEPGHLEIERTEVPNVQDDEVLIKVGYVTLCGSDTHSFQYGPYVPPKDPNKKIGLGHEFSGTVVGVGKDVTKFKVGDRVCCEPGIPCYKCEFCLAGHYNVCPDVDFMATSPNYKGALTKYISHPENMTFHLPENMSLIEGALVEPTAVAVHLGNVAGTVLGKTVVVLGSGFVGIMTIQTLKLMGASKIIAVDLLDSRLHTAKEVGATHIFNSKSGDVVKAIKGVTGEYGADVVIEAAGSVATAKMGLDIVKRSGKILIVGTVPGETPVDFLKINREVTIQTVFRYCNNYQRTINLISDGAYKAGELVDKIFDYDEVQEGFEFAVNHATEMSKAAIRVDDSL